MLEAVGPHGVSDPNAEERFEALKRFGVDLTERAAEGRLDPVIGRDEEIRRVDPGAEPPHEEQPRADR